MSWGPIKGLKLVCQAMKEIFTNFIAAWVLNEIRIFQKSKKNSPVIFENEIDGLQRIRFTSPHPKDFKEETIFAVRDLDKVCNQIHVPLQSGSSKLLSKMHRGYNKERFIQKIDMIKYIFGNKISEVLRMTLMIFKFHLGKTY